jgi:hypothetical protein
LWGSRGHHGRPPALACAPNRGRPPALFSPGPKPHAPTPAHHAAPVQQATLSCAAAGHGAEPPPAAVFDSPVWSPAGASGRFQEVASRRSVRSSRTPPPFPIANRPPKHCHCREDRPPLCLRCRRHPQFPCSPSQPLIILSIFLVSMIVAHISLNTGAVLPS